MIEGHRKAGNSFNRERLERVVLESDQQRFVIAGDRIRANQGHSVKIDLELKPVISLDELFRGTVQRFMEKIMADGLRKMNRHHVNLSQDIVAAEKAGSRRGTPVILKIDSAAMHEDGHDFMCSENGVWLTESVPASYISVVVRDV